MLENTPPRFNILYQNEVGENEAIIIDLDEEEDEINEEEEENEIRQYMGIESSSSDDEDGHGHGHGDGHVDEGEDEDNAECECDNDEGGESSQPVEQVDAALNFQEHGSNKVYGCSLNSVFKLAATGAEDKLVFVWCIQTGAVIKVIKAHRDFVTEVHWSHDGVYLATSNLCGDVLIHKLQKAELDGPWSLSQTCKFLLSELVWMRWQSAANILLAGSERGEVHAWRIPSGDCTTLPGPGVSCDMGALTGDGNMLLTGYGNGLLKLWNLTTYATVMVVDDQHMKITTTPHSGLLTAIACDKNAPLYMSGDMNSKIVFSSNNGPVGTVTASGPVESLAFSPSAELKLAASTTMDGHVQIWNFTTYSLHMQFKHRARIYGILNIDWISDHTLLGRGRMGDISGYDVRSGLRKFTLSGHDYLVEDLEYDLSEGVLLSAGDKGANIFKLPKLDD